MTKRKPMVDKTLHRKLRLRNSKPTKNVFWRFK